MPPFRSDPHGGRRGDRPHTIGMTHLQCVESVKTNIIATTIARLAEGFDVDPQELLAPCRHRRRGSQAGLAGSNRRTAERRENDSVLCLGKRAPGAALAVTGSSPRFP